ncbi:MAG TPA: hypothetical protein VI612_03395 [Candidatus Nanoarchaeia archaeon]|nr:hypothetical protein [Candidatus Nanoarchaeia archaeon]
MIEYLVGFKFQKEGEEFRSKPLLSASSAFELANGLLDVLSQYPTHELTIYAKGNKITVGVSYETIIKAMDGADFHGHSYVEIGGQKLEELIRRNQQGK